MTKELANKTTDIVRYDKHRDLRRITGGLEMKLADFVLDARKDTCVYFSSLTQDRRIRQLWTAKLSLAHKIFPREKEPEPDLTPMINMEELLYLFRNSSDLNRGKNFLFSGASLLILRRFFVKSLW